ncbi:MAG: hypothetical protein IT210_20535 [Armatimonadetes bacterium]|nr:hypothetical protein [Armatimonadota bacterium]
MVVLTIPNFRSDPQGARFADVVQDKRINFQHWLDFFNDPIRQLRMEDSETHHDRPALAGVIRELEQHPHFKPYLENNDAHTTQRGRQAIGVIVRMIMLGLGWRKTGRKGSLGQRATVPPGTTTPGAYHNASGLSQWFTRSERYEI